jgi:hypothetical protein
MTTINPVHCFAAADDTFSEFDNPFLTHGVSHLGAQRATMQVNAVRRVTYNQPYDLFAWVRESSVDASTDHRTVILHCIDIALPLHVSVQGANGRIQYARQVFAGMLRNAYHGDFRAEDKVLFYVARAKVITETDRPYVRILSVEDLS